MCELSRDGIDFEFEDNYAQTVRTDRVDTKTTVIASSSWLFSDVLVDIIRSDDTHRSDCYFMVAVKL